MKTKPYDTSTWSTHPLHPKTKSPETVEWIFLIDLLNFSFFSDETDPEQQFYVTYKGERYTGYWSLCAAVNRALDAGIPITSPRYWIETDEDMLRGIFRGEGVEPMPLLYIEKTTVLTTGTNE
jgi:Potential Queuosine, Q, salvage protein family